MSYLGVDMKFEEAFLLSLAAVLFSTFVIYVQAYLKSPFADEEEVQEEISKS